MNHPPRLTRERIERLLESRRGSAHPHLEQVIDEKIHCLTESHFGDIDEYYTWLHKSHPSGAGSIRVVSLTSGDLTNLAGEKARALCWKVLQKLNRTQKAGKVSSWQVPILGGGLGTITETSENYDLEKHQRQMTQDNLWAIVPVLMDRIPDNPTRDVAHQLAENLSDGRIRVLCLWSRSLGPTSHGDEMGRISFPTDDLCLIDDEELTTLLVEIDPDFKDAHHFDNSFGQIWTRLLALEKALQREALQHKRVANSLSQHLFDFLRTQYDKVDGPMSRMPVIEELKELFFFKELPRSVDHTAFQQFERTLKRAENLKLITQVDSSKSTKTYDLNPALHAAFECNSAVPTSSSATLHSLQISAIKAKEKDKGESSIAADLILPEFRPGATAASRLKTLLLLNQGRRIPMWLVSHPTMGGTSAFRVIRDRYRDSGHVTFGEDPISKLQVVQVQESLGAAAPSFAGNMLDVSTQLITPTRETFTISNPLVGPEFVQSIEMDVLNGSPSFTIMKKVFLALPNIPVWEYWMIWLLSVRLKPETIDRDLRDLVKPGHRDNLPGLLRIPHDKAGHDCKGHSDFDKLWARSMQSKQLSGFVDEWANKIPRVVVNQHTFTHGLDWYIYVPK